MLYGRGKQGDVRECWEMYGREMQGNAGRCREMRCLRGLTVGLIAACDVGELMRDVGVLDFGCRAGRRCRGGAGWGLGGRARPGGGTAPAAPSPRRRHANRCAAFSVATEPAQRRRGV